MQYEQEGERERERERNQKRSSEQVYINSIVNVSCQSCTYGANSRIVYIGDRLAPGQDGRYKVGKGTTGRVEKHIGSDSFQSPICQSGRPQ